MEQYRGRKPPLRATGVLRLAGVDYGTVRIGLAVADTQLKIATPHGTYVRQDARRDAAFFRQFVAQQRIDRLIVGLPVHLSGRESATSTEVREFGQWLQAQTGVRVEFFDERFTTREAEQALLSAGVTRKKRKGRVDKVAAQMLLDAYLQHAGPRTDQPGPLED